MPEKFINIEFPFQDDNKGKLLAMNDISESAIKSDLIHLLLTNTNERLYLPSFGANLRKYIFEQNDETVQGDIKNEIQNAITKFIPNLVVDTIELSSGIPGQIRDEHHVLVTLDYTVTDGAFNKSDSIEIEL
jgi:phage baseplate assembly protein W